MQITLVLVTMLLAVTTACRKNANSARKVETESTTVGSASTSLLRFGPPCPGMMTGAHTKVVVTGSDVVVKITSDDKDTIAAIQTSTDELLAMKSDDMYNVKGPHGAAIAPCPLYVPEDATAKATHEKDGITVTITPKDKPDDLKKAIDERSAHRLDER